MDPKAQCRETLLTKRRQLSPKFVCEASQKVGLHLFSLEEFNLAERVGFYSSFDNEIETEPLFLKSHALRKEIFYPAVDPKTEEIHFYQVRSLKELKPGYCGILEPAKREHALHDINYLSLIVIPGVAFDSKGNRLGFGKGFYDKLLAGFQGKKVALAYEFQMCDSLPVTKGRDQRVDIIVTEERILRII
ncbi:MAG: 5-formyltetrahydrofolate cyclo-ligase [Deltaproteobacteria bacterium]|nr:5-formyltetrahydrofolate cyclo-ligase [Deltaproteobacteria bacterium]